MSEPADGPTLDDARDFLNELLTRAELTRWVSGNGLTVQYVEDGGSDRHSRLLAFELISTTGPIVEFFATITIDGPFPTELPDSTT